MEITSSKKYTTFTAIDNFDSFVEQFNTVFPEYKHQNIVLNLADINVTEDKIQSLQTYATQQAVNKQSFVIIIPSFDADAFEEELNVVPTLTEAEDLIDMDEISRDLGF